MNDLHQNPAAVNPGCPGDGTQRKQFGRHFAGEPAAADPQASSTSAGRPRLPDRADWVALREACRGAVTFVPFAYRLLSRKRTGGTDSARYCYGVWLRHLVMAGRAGLPTRPRSIAELGPGDSLGIGLAALLSGAECYQALDAVAFADLPRNLQVFDELVDLFRRRAPIPDRAEWPDVTPYLESYEFPHHLLPPERLEPALDVARVARIRAALSSGGDGRPMIRYSAPWDDASILAPGSIDLLFSQAVLEHVDDLEGAYERMYRWLKPGGFMSHSIDFRCHRTAGRWNGHWTYSDRMWRVIRGRRPYLINRRPFSAHHELAAGAGFTWVGHQTTTLPSTLCPDELAPAFRDLSDDDLTTATAFVQARKPGDAQG